MPLFISVAGYQRFGRIYSTLKTEMNIEAMRSPPKEFLDLVHLPDHTGHVSEDCSMAIVLLPPQTFVLLTKWKDTES
jgi:hypothetical protein